MIEDICIQDFTGLALRERGTKVDCVVQCRKADGTEINLCGPSEVFILIGAIIKHSIEEKIDPEGCKERAKRTVELLHLVKK